jgi:hypothetical protein
MKSQNSRNQCFSYYFCLMIEESGSISLINGSGCGSGEAQKHMDPTDPDPQHCFKMAFNHETFYCGRLRNLTYARRENYRQCFLELVPCRYNNFLGPTDMFIFKF